MGNSNSTVYCSIYSSHSWHNSVRFIDGNTVLSPTEYDFIIGHSSKLNPGEQTERM